MSAKKRTMWREVTKDGKRALRSPNGEDRKIKPTVSLPPVLHVLLGAIARYRGETVEETLADVLKSDLLAAIDCAQGEGLPTLPLTRHERDALRTLGFDADALSGDYESILAGIAGGAE